jgi:cytochrome b involved in lipid metabolism
MKYILIILLVLLIGSLICLGYWIFKNQKHQIFDYFNIQEYSIEEIEKHNTKESLWLHYEGQVYDITGFISKHPGGSILLKAGGKNLKSVWEEEGVGWHLKNTYVTNILERYKIGILKV